MEYIQKFFRRHRVSVDGVMTGANRKQGAREEDRKWLETLFANQYQRTIHIDNRSLLRVDSAAKAYEEHPLSGDPDAWSREVMEIIGAMEGHES